MTLVIVGGVDVEVVEVFVVLQNSHSSSFFGVSSGGNWTVSILVAS